MLYKVKKGKTFYIDDPGKEFVKYSTEEFKKHWISMQSDSEEKGIAMFLEPTPAFYEKQTDDKPTEVRSFKLLFDYIRQYQRCFLSFLSKHDELSFNKTAWFYVVWYCVSSLEYYFIILFDFIISFS